MAGGGFKDERGNLLMLAHVAPDPGGPGRRARAWQLLAMLRSRYDIDLICAANGPIHLTQWRHVSRLVRKLQIEPGATRLTDTPGGHHTDASRFMSTLSRWVGETEYEAALVTDAQLAPLLDRTESSCRICDLSILGSVATRRIAAVKRGLARARLIAQAQRESDAEHRAASLANLVTVSHATGARHAMPTGGQLLVVPPGVDTHSLDEIAPAPDFHLGGDPRLAVVVDPTEPSQRRAAREFLKATWPGIQRSLPTAQLDVVPITVTAQWRQTLAHATAVAIPGSAPLAGRWPMLQAMALGKPIMLSRDATASLPVRHRDTALLAAHPEDWMHHAIELLHSPPLQRQLGEAGRAYLEDRGTLETTGRTLLAALRGEHEAPSLTLRRAA